MHSRHLHIQTCIPTQRAIEVNVMRRREKVVPVYKELAVTLKASQSLSHGRTGSHRIDCHGALKRELTSYEAVSSLNVTGRQLVIYYEIAALCVTPFRTWPAEIASRVLATMVAVVWASLEEEHGGTTYHETSKPVEIPIYKKYAIPIPHPVPVPVPQQIKIPIPQPYQVPIAVPHPVPVEVVKHIEIPVEKPEPYVVEKKIPYVVEKPYPVTVEKHFPVPIPKPYPVHVPVYKHVFHHQSSGHGWKH
ncbi:hypothetical protein X777_01714 [Ooceraea biroi]|uniref:Zinc finger protein 512B n=1 Tax=Ooceraea biroi TaxID=2015173 RepID=A0A026WMH5_OOCBI|nr:hypothetical protein X777_01714 [Ooceraea biroi]